MTRCGPVVAIAGWAFALVLCMSERAFADSALAESLFREGRALLDAGKVDEACLKLAESQTQEASSGTLLNLAFCRQQQGRLASAWADYLAAARLARTQGRQDRAEIAEREAAALEPRLPRLTIQVSAPLDGATIRRDDTAVGPGVLGSEVPVDPGSHVVTVTAPGHDAWTTTIAIEEGERKTVVVPPLERVPVTVEPVPPAPAPTSPPVASVTVPPSLPPPVAASAEATWGWAIGAAGVVSLGVGAGFGLGALSNYDDADTLCPERTACSTEAIDARDRAEAYAWVSNVGWLLGAAGVGVGLYLLVSPDAEPTVGRWMVTTRARPTSLGVGVERSF